MSSPHKNEIDAHRKHCGLSRRYARRLSRAWRRAWTPGRQARSARRGEGAR